MLEDILSVERELFLAINHFHTPWLDATMLIYTGFPVWIPFILFLCIMLVYRKPKKEWAPVMVALGSVIIIGIIISGLLFKPFFHRFRPTFHPDFMDDIKRVLDYTGGGLYGFISGHSTFSFSIATFTAFLFRYKPYTIVVYIWAIVMVYSRLYLGVHFISDVIPGILVGILVGWGVYRFYLHYLTKKNPELYLCPAAIYSGEVKGALAIALACYIFVIFMIGFVWSQSLY
ncbi:MAG: phosphatase PAP2 family protein [Bacteroides sp.]|nr:phosphatase PAP2 family protein [Bacteroides sp.]